MKLLPLSCFLSLGLLASGCVHTYPPEIAGQRTDSQGRLTARIIRVNRMFSYGLVIAPDGPRDYKRITCRYYFQEDGKPEREFFIGKDRTHPFVSPFLAVSNSPLWVAYDETTIWTNDPVMDNLNIYIFDDQGYFRRRTFVALPKAAWKAQYDAEFTPEGGNRIVAFKSPKGWKKYDVVNDTVTDAEP